MQTEIRSTQNGHYKYFKSLQRKKERVQNRSYVIEGIKSVQDAIAAGKAVQAVLVSDRFLEHTPKRFWGDVDTYIIADAIFAPLCDTQTPQGIAAVLGIEDREAFTPKENGFYIYCDHVADPGNLGTIIRTADAAGVDGVLLSEGCVDLYSPKTVRSSMGSFFHIEIWQDVSQEQLLGVQQAGYQVLSACLGENTINYTQADYKKPTVIVLGNEANGVAKELQERSDFCVKIPIVGKAESLNVGIAGAVLMYEALRQRQ